MIGAEGLRNAIERGRIFQERVIAMEATKGRASLDEMTAQLNQCVVDFRGSIQLDIEPRIAFGDIRAMSIHGGRCHLQMAHVSLDSKRCILYFDTSFMEGSRKFDFIARSWVFWLVLAEFLREGHRAADEFALETGDSGYLGDVAYCSKNAAGCLIPDPDFMATDGYAGFRRICEASLPAWADRIPKIFWRGSTTGHRLWTAPADAEPDDLRWLPRLALCVACRASEVADICDVGVASLVQIPEPYLQARIRASGLMRDPVPRELFLQNRAAFDIDGNSNAWSGLFCSLLGASCVFKIASRDDYRQWYYSHLVPWENYVPVGADLSDLPRAVAWFREDQSEAERIAARGRQLAIGMDTSSEISASARVFGQWLGRRASVAA